MNGKDFIVSAQNDSASGMVGDGALLPAGAEVFAAGGQSTIGSTSRYGETRLRPSPFTAGRWCAGAKVLDGFTMDDTLEPDYRFQFAQLTDHPTMDLHLRVSEHKAEALLWLNGARYRMIGVRDEEPGAPGRPTPTDRADEGRPR